MTQRFTNRLRELEAEHGFRVLYACEAGSRAWGFESEDRVHQRQGELAAIEAEIISEGYPLARMHS